MILRNYTPFVPLLFQSRNVRGQEFWTVALRGTFRIAPYAALVPDPDQRPIVEADVFHGEPGRSSIRMESDLAPFKPRADVHVNAVATAPGTHAVPSFLTRMEVGKIDKTLRVTGPRRWVKERGRWRLTEPEPCVEVPVRYEHAFGGMWSNNWGDVDVFEENPSGTAYLKPGEEPSGDVLLAPRIESPDDPVGAIGRVHRPEGLGPIGRAWLPRRALAGTFDEKWKQERWPDLPIDFDFAHYNSAHPDLVYPGYLDGDEEVALTNLHPSGELRFSLPRYRLALQLRLSAGPMAAASVNLDTLLLDLPEDRAHLTWRATFVERAPIRVVEVRLTDAGGSRG